MKTENEIFEDSFETSLEFSLKKAKKISKDPPKSRFL